MGAEVQQVFKPSALTFGQLVQAVQDAVALNFSVSISFNQSQTTYPPGSTHVTTGACSVDWAVVAPLFPSPFHCLGVNNAMQQLGSIQPPPPAGFSQDFTVTTVETYTDGSGNPPSTFTYGGGINLSLPGETVISVARRGSVPYLSFCIYIDTPINSMNGALLIYAFIYIFTGEPDDWGLTAPHPSTTGLVMTKTKITYLGTPVTIWYTSSYDNSRIPNTIPEVIAVLGVTA